MLFDDTYNTIVSPSEGIYKEKGSKFLAFAEPVSFEAEAKKILESYRKEYYDARHHCFAWAIGPGRESQRANDDGEPSGTAGKPIYGQILSFDITNVIIVVVRYFGGTKLGVSGLIKAYKTAAREALLATEIASKTVNEVYELVFDYAETNEVMRAIKEKNIEIGEIDYQENCRVIFAIRKNNAIMATESLRKINNVKISYLRRE
jgi:uncharacterized YigZ family protein